jgi:predicted metal-binding membrane protein
VELPVAEVFPASVGDVRSRESEARSHASALDAVARRDRFFLLAGLIGISILSWGYTIALAGHSAVADAVVHAHTRSWTGADFGMTFVMWGVMMVAMMAPTVAPMLLALARIDRAQPEPSGPLLPATLFLAGYLLIWTGFSLVATLAQWRLHELTWVTASGASEHAAFGGLLLLSAGAFQLTPLKQACLSRCRSPLLFLMSAWRPGSWGGLRMGILHGAFCIGCCWALMALMFVAGTMNLLWCAALMLLMLAEKSLPTGRQVGRAAGVGLMGWGMYALCSGLIRA